MADTILSDSIDEKINQIERVVAAIAQGANEDKLRELREVLISLAGVLERDPGIEMAADDLYAAAMVVVLDGPVGVRPLARKYRLLEASRDRLVVRLRRVGRCGASGASCGASPAGVPVPWPSGLFGGFGARVLCAPSL